MNRLQYRGFQWSTLVIQYSLSPTQLSIDIKDAIDSIVAYTIDWCKQWDIPAIVWITDVEFVALKWLYQIRKNSKIPEELFSQYKFMYWEWEYKLLLKEIENWISTQWQDVILRKINSKERKEINEALVNLENWNSIIDRLETLSKSISKQKIKKVKYVKNKWDSIFLVLSDWHLWWENHEDTLRRINEFIDFAVNTKESKINLILPWDFVETWTLNWMHWWSQLRSMKMQWKETEMIDVVVEQLQKIIDTLIYHWKKLTIFATNWNHDRDWQDHVLFWRSVSLYSIFFLLKKIYDEEFVEIHYWNEPVNSLIIDWVQVILYHWDDRISIDSYEDITKRERILWLEHSLPTISICWHLHFSWTQLLWKNKAAIWVSTIAWSWWYWRNLWYYTVDWFTHFTFRNGKFSITNELLP